MPWACVWKVLGRVSLPIGAPLGNLEGDPSTGNFEN